MRLGVIYRIRIKNNFIFGSTLDINRRKNYHLYLLKENKHDNSKLQELYNKYKEIRFKIVQKDVPEDILRIVEDIWIGANCSKKSDNKGGLNVINGSCTQVKFKEQLSQHRSEVQKRIMSSLTLEEKRKRTIKMKLSKLTNIKKIGENISKGKKNKCTNWDNNQSFPVLQIDLQGNPLKLWSSAYQAQVQKGYLSCRISGVCKKKYGQKTYKKYKWEYVKKEDILKYNHLRDVEVPICLKSRKNIKVFQKDINNNIIKVWKNSKKICEYYNIKPPTVSILIKKGIIKDNSVFSFE
jgi:hypothetical protein